MFAIDTNLLIYAHNEDSEFHKRAVAFLERVMNEQDEDGNPTICFSTQVFTEFINVITRQTLRKPLSLDEAIDVVQEYLDAGIQVNTPDFEGFDWLTVINPLKDHKNALIQSEITA